MTIGWTQPLCETCFQAWKLGTGRPPVVPSLTKEGGEELCLICGRLTRIYVRVDPALARLHQHPKETL